jgi:hypothetical protein
MSHSRTGERTWIDEAADRFEQDWKRGGDRPRIEDFLTEEAGPRRSLLLHELLRVECELRRSAGETPGPDEYRQRFSDDHAAVDAVFGHDVHVDPPRKPRGDAAQSLLIGLLALQKNFIDRDSLRAGFNIWVADFSSSCRLLKPYKSLIGMQLVVLLGAWQHAGARHFVDRLRRSSRSKQQD